MQQYLDVLKDITANGDVKTDRTGTGTTSKFGGMMKFSLRHGIWPIVTTRKVAYEKVAQELEWMLKGIISVDWLKDRDNKIWNAWAGPESGTIGPMYGEQWRNWAAGLTKLSPEDEAKLLVMIDNETGYASEATQTQFARTTVQAVETFKKFLAEKTKLYEQGGRGGVDQLAYVVNELKNNPDSRRIVVNVWHAGLLPDTTMSPGENADAGRMALAPCHSMWQVATAEMSDFEIMRYCLDSDERFQPKIEEVFNGMRGLNHEQQETYLKLLANQFLFNQGYVFPKDGLNSQYNLGDDSHLELTGAGQSILDKVLTNGKRPRKLSLSCYARSQDVPLGTVFNVGMYSLLAHLLAEVTGTVPWEYTHFMGDHHIYHNQKEGVATQLKRTPMKPCRVIVDPTLEDITQFKAENLTVYYESHPIIKFPMAAV